MSGGPGWYRNALSPQLVLFRDKSILALLFSQVFVPQSMKHCSAEEQRICETDQQPTQASIVSLQKPQIKKRNARLRSDQYSLAEFFGCISAASVRSLHGVLYRQSKWRTVIEICTVTLGRLMALFCAVL